MALNVEPGTLPRPCRAWPRGGGDSANSRRRHRQLRGPHRTADLLGFSA
jgi:hypothetical protein